jgi:probable HAF family extracellular repeat protein
MKITRGFKVRSFILAGAFSAGLGFGTGASAQQIHSYLIDLNSKTVIDIGTLGGNSGASDINEAGQVAGVSGTAGDDVYHAFITGLDGMGAKDLGTFGGMTVLLLASMMPDRWRVGPGRLEAPSMLSSPAPTGWA